MAIAILAIAGVVTYRGLWADRIPEDAVVVPRDVETLQEALERAVSGDVIIVQASEISLLQGPLRISVPRVTLATTGGRVDLRCVGVEAALTIDAEGVVVRGFDITSESIGIHVQAGGSHLEDLSISNTPVAIQLSGASRCVLRSIDMDEGDIGLAVTEAAGVDAQSMTITGMSQYGIRLRGARDGVFRDIELVGNDVGVALEEGSTDNSILTSLIRDCIIAGIEIRASNGNAVRESTVDTCRVGLLLEGVTGVEIERCSIERSSVSGVMLQQSVQNRVVETAVHGSGASGVQLSQSHENALLYNEITDCEQTGIQAMTSGKNLILGNRIARCGVGLEASGSDELHILRNEIVSSATCGAFISECRSCRVFDNDLAGGSFGVVLTACEDTKALRNTIESADTAALSTMDSRGGNQLTENVARASVWGALIVGSAQDLWAYNVIEANDVGCWLAGIGDGLRIEGNTFADNRIALGLRSDGAWLNDALGALSLVSSSASGDSLPLLANNVFLGSTEADIRNEGTVTLLAAGNWWGSDVERDASSATTFGDVSLDVSAWKGTIAVGSGVDDVSLVLGRVLQQALEGAGYRVIDLVGMGTSDRLQQALLDADVDLIWWDGVEADEPAASLADGEPAVISTRASHGWRIVVSAGLAEQLTEATASALGHWYETTGEQLRYTSTTSLGDEAFGAFTAAYALQDSVRSFTPSASLSEVEALLKFGAVDVAIVRSLEETLTVSGFVALDDDRDVLEERAISMIVKASLENECPDVLGVLSSLGERITESVLHDLVSRVRLLRKEPADVAGEFLATTDD